jgi:hypothetical protein
MKLRCAVLVTILMLGFAVGAQAQGEDKDDWKQVIKTSDVTVDIKKMEGTNVYGVRASGYMKASVAAIENCLRDLEVMRKVVFRFDTADLINEPELGLISTQDVRYVYGKLDAPWPVQDRDCVGLFRFWIDPKTSVLTCDFKAQKTDYRLDKEAKERIRVNLSNGIFTLAPKEKDLTYVVVEMLGDPAGDIPVGVINLFSRYGALYTFKKLREAATSEKFNNPSARIITTTLLQN